jgi:hypothetical protein
MDRDARFEGLTAMWAEAFRDAQALSVLLCGDCRPVATSELVAIAQKVLLDDERPALLLAG